MELLLLVVALEFPAALALLDCSNRRDDEFAGGGPDRRAWVGWLVVAVATAWFLVGNGIVLAYYYAVVRRNVPS